MVSFIYIIFASLGVLAMGSSVDEIVLFSLPNGRADVKFFQILYAVALALTYPLQILPAFNIMENSEIIKKFIQPQQDNWKMRRFLFRTCVTIVNCFIAFGVPRFAVFLNIIGGICGTSLQFIFPVIIYE
jgi:proton-coupled amino acid transporter